MLLQSQNIMKKNLDKILAEISAGELIDKITILNIKKEKITNNEKLVEIEKIAANSIPYIPIWISSQKAWSQNKISKPIFNGAGIISLSDLELINE